MDDWLRKIQYDNDTFERDLTSFWVNGDGARPVPKSAYFANGAGGQRTIIIPTHDLVVVRMGHHKGDRAGMKTLDLALAELMAAVPERKTGTRD